VTAYSHRDDNNQWMIKPATILENRHNADSELSDAEPQLLLTGSYIRLQHVLYVIYFTFSFSVCVYYGFCASFNLYVINSVSLFICILQRKIIAVSIALVLPEYSFLFVIYFHKYVFFFVTLTVEFSACLCANI